ncbi:MAG: linear amide C-N hydrolase, partial [Candidatus Onthovivens sp.]|nr:linear amide C-N hydrolase [Candidatus Onthovivens sp.]
MCTAISFSSNNNHYFGRNLDLNYPFKESIIVTPRKYEIRFKCLEPMKDHYAIFGVGISKFDYPLYFDCINEYGLGFAGLNFPEFANFNKPIEGKINIQPYELPLYMLGKYKTVKEVKEAFKNVYLSNIPLDEKLPVSTLHFIFSDSTGSIVVEQTSDGLKIYD